MADEKMTADKFVRSGYEVNPTANGGFFVSLPHGLYTNTGRMKLYCCDTASFTNSSDFLAWLSTGHAVYDKELAK